MNENKLWPASLQIPLFRAAFLSNEAGIQAWELWKSQVNMDNHPDLGSFRLLPQLYHNLQNLGIADPVMMKLKGIARRNWYKNQQFFRSLVPPLQALHKAGIECMLLYEPVFALNYHTDYALGSDTNLAILVRAEQARQAIKQIQALGWQPERRLPDALIEPYLATGWMHVFQDAAGRIIQLYWHLLPECRTAEAGSDFWDGAVTTKVYDMPVLILNPADQILHSCVEDNSTVELPNFMRAINVMLIIKTTPDLDWDRLLTQAQKYRLVMPLLTVLDYIQDALDEPLPPTIWLRLQSLPISRQDRVEYRLKRSHPQLWRRFWQVWFDYRRHTSSVSLTRDLLGFPRYLQHFWRLSDLRQVPGLAMSILRERLRR